ncbi:hypothetical protein FCV25MIE_09078 [Fagus crenata]
MVKRSKEVVAEATKRAKQIEFEAVKQVEQIKHLLEGISPCDAVFNDQVGEVVRRRWDTVGGSKEEWKRGGNRNGNVWGTTNLLFG